MRIDFSWGSDRARIDHPVCRLAELVLSPWVSDRSFGPGLPWLDVLFVTNGKRAARPPKASWRWRNSFAEHLIVELSAPQIDDMDEVEAVRTLISHVDQAVQLAKPLLDPDRPFASTKLRACVAECLDKELSARQLQKLKEPLQQTQRRAAIVRGKEAMRREWNRPLIKPLTWVRMFPVLGKGVRASSVLQKECRIVGGLLGSALYQATPTPRYSEIYVNVGSDADTLRAERTAVEEWHENAYALLSPSHLVESESRALRRALYGAARSALLELAEIDHLDATSMKSRLDAVDVDGLSTEFVYKRIEKEGRYAEIFYTLADRRDSGAILQPNFHLRIGLSGAKASTRCLLGPIDVEMAGGSISKFELRRNEARVLVEGEVVTVAFPG